MFGVCVWPQHTCQALHPHVCILHGTGLGMSYAMLHHAGRGDASHPISVLHVSMPPAVCCGVCWVGRVCVHICVRFLSVHGTWRTDSHTFSSLHVFF